MDLGRLSFISGFPSPTAAFKVVCTAGVLGKRGGLIIPYTTLDCVKEKTFNEALTDYSKWHCLKKEQIEGGKIL